MTARRFLVWYWSNPGGGRRYAFCLARRLAQLFGPERVTLSVRADDPHADMAEAIGLPVLRAALVSDRKRPLSTSLGLARGAALLAEHIRKSGADAVLLAMNFALAAPLARLCLKPIVYFAHDPAPHPGDFTPFMQRMTQKILLARARRVVGLSAHSVRELARFTDPAKLVCAPLGAVFEPQGAPRPPLQEGPIRLLFAGRLMRYKGLDMLAHALSAIEARQDWRLTIAGEGPEAAAVGARFSRFQQAAPVQAGWLGDEELLEMQRRHDILLAPYVSATQSGAVAESLALGAPVIATPAGALAEQVGDGGWISQTADASAYAVALMRALDERAGYAAKSAAALAQAQTVWNSDWGWLHKIG